MTLHISPYLQPYLTLATKLPDQFPDVPEAVVQALQARIRKLVEYVAARDEEIWQREMHIQDVEASVKELRDQIAEMLSLGEFAKFTGGRR